MNYPKEGFKVVNMGKHYMLEAEAQVKDETRKSESLDIMNRTAMAEFIVNNPADAKTYMETLKLKTPDVLKEGLNARQMRLRLSAGKADFYESILSGLKEDLNTTNTQPYTTFLEQMVRGDYLAEIDRVMGLVYVNDDLMKMRGGNALAISIGEPTTAAVYGEGGQVTYYSEGVNKITVSPVKIMAGTAITWELNKYAMPSFMKWNLRRISNSLQRYVASYILTTLAVGCGNTPITGGFSYANAVKARKDVISATTTAGVPYGFMPNKIVLSPEGAEKFYTDSTIKNYVYFTAIMNNKYTDMARPVMYFFGLEVIETPYLNVSVGGAAVQAMILDSERAGMFIKASDVEVFEGRLPKSVDREIIMAMLMTVVVTFPKAIQIITA